jgi:xylan 1,4-beta-xylosidase
MRVFSGTPSPPKLVAQKFAFFRTRKTALLCLLFFALLGTAVAGQAPPVRITVQADRSEGNFSPVWNYFGYDEPNYSYTANGTKLLGELAAISPGPTYIRVHNLLTSGDGSASLKWGSTNVYTEDTSGNPVYGWTIIDRIFDALRSAGVKPLVEIGFMPEALSTHPHPYRHNFPRVPATEIYTGWAYPPKDYKKWSDLVFSLAQHLRDRYGEAEVNTWLWEVWNEPDIGYWQGTRDEYFKLYDFTAQALLRAIPSARLGGPDTTGPGSPQSADFLRAFLDHCAHGKNFADGSAGSHLDFISFHPKGSPVWKGDHVRMGLSHQLSVIEQGFKIVASFPEWRTTPIIFGESDPEGCAACSAKDNPQNLYRDGPLYGAYTLEVLFHALQLAHEQHVNLAGSVTWAFEFESQPFFAGFRTLATNGVDKPVLNAFRMLGMLGGEKLRTSSSGALPTEQVVSNGIRSRPEINAIATRKNKNKDRELDILLWNYHDDDIAAPDATIDLDIEGLPTDVHRALVEHFRTDANHSSSFTAWKEMGSPQPPSEEQYKLLENAGQLQLLNSPVWLDVKGQILHLQFTLPRQAISLLRLSYPTKPSTSPTE